MQLDLTELSSYLPLVSCFEFGNVSGKLFPCTEGRVRTRMTSAGTPRAGAFDVHHFKEIIETPREPRIFFLRCSLARAEGMAAEEASPGPPLPGRPPHGGSRPTS